MSIFEKIIWAWSIILHHVFLTYFPVFFQAYFGYVMLRKGKGMIRMLKSKVPLGLEIGENTCENL